jgi:hypothetical protein
VASRQVGTGRMWVVVYAGVVNGQVVVGVVVVGVVVVVGIVVVGVVGVTIAVVVVTADVVVVHVVIGLTREGWRKDRMDDFKMIGLILVGSVDSKTVYLVHWSGCCLPDNKYPGACSWPRKGGLGWYPPLHTMQDCRNKVQNELI